MQCLNKDNPGKDVDWRKLNELEDEIIEHDTDNDGIVSLEEVHLVVKFVDPQKPVKELDRILSTGFGCSEEQLQPAVDESGYRMYNGKLSAPVSDIIKRLRTSIVRRHSKRKSVREQQNQASIVKIMQNIENPQVEDQ